ncbi:hypothetical protein MAR_020892 [Mya arenaria]|uniref:Ig-like domain-containing protein n=1 Tax=Mya arenaria TaxID=6604 RepID=A0ABY7E655_MYAAR|nr:hypothetical protein MAR_020892 [Mya arenaria]
MVKGLSGVRCSVGISASSSSSVVDGCRHGRHTNVNPASFAVAVILDGVEGYLRGVEGYLRGVDNNEVDVGDKEHMLVVAGKHVQKPRWSPCLRPLPLCQNGPKLGTLQNVRKVRGETFVYKCLYTPGNPPTVDFEWTRSGTNVSWIIQKTHNLTILNVQRSDEANYTCKVSSVLQPTLSSVTTTQYDTATFYLDVLYGAENLILHLNNVSHESVEIEEHSSNHFRCLLESDPGAEMSLTKDSSARRPSGVEVQLNFTARQYGNATLVYKVVAYPVPKHSQFVWKRCSNGSSCDLLPDDINKFEINTEGLTSTLTILDVQIEDYRLYQLSVSNGVGDTLVEWLHLRPIDHTKSSSSAGPVVGEAIGGTFGALVAIVVVVVILRRKRALKCMDSSAEKIDDSAGQSVSVKENPGHNAAKADADVPTDTSVYDALKAGDNGPDNSHVYMPLDVSITKAQVYNENVEKDDPVYNNTVLQNPVQTML